MRMKEKELERMFKAFANKRRLAIIRYVRKQREASVGDIASEIKLSFNATSKHLLLLSAANILDKEQRSLQMFYRIADELSPPARQALAIL
jgi:DNA-binding transcriptional ArsR family regulator